MPNIMDDVLHLEAVEHTRANHALEHATLNVLESGGLKSSLAGISDVSGFWIVGNISTDVLFEAAREGLRRLQSGESQLAIHERCGTNYASGALLGGSLAWLGMRGKPKLSRLPLAVMLGALGFSLAKPLGPRLQREITTTSEVQRLALVGIKQHVVAGGTAHRIRTSWSA